MTFFFSQALRYRLIVLTALFFALLPLQQASADVRAEARSYASSGKLKEALIATNRYLSDHPDDSDMLFLKGLILTKQDKREDAIEVFTRMTSKHPALPEPYNNLAVLYAANGQFDKARAALEKGMRTHPAYATTYENLGAIYAKLSSQAYAKALQSKSERSSDTTQLALVNSLSTGEVSTKVEGIIVAATPQAELPSETKPEEATSSPTTTPANSDTQQAAATDSPDHAAIVKTLDDWADAWSARDVKKYLSFYANDFKLPRGKSRRAWEEDRRARIVNKKRIAVKVQSPQISLSGSTANVKFKQHYSSNRLSSTSRKTMAFVKSNGEWKILLEKSY